MGQHADDLLDYYERKYTRPHNEFFNGPKKQHKPTWTTLKGQTLYVEDMETSHLINSVNKLRREGREMFQPLIDELKKRGHNI